MSDNAQNQQGFSKLRSAVWPIHGWELKKFLPMSLLMASILFIYTTIRELKDTFVQTKAHLWAGADSLASANLISALKFFYVFPLSFVAVMIFTKLVGKFDFNKTFYIITSFFAIYFFLFTFLLYPNADSLIPTPEVIASWRDRVPGFLRDFITCALNWPYALFYILAEIWGTMGIASLFWQFGNAVTMKSEVKRFFPFYSLIGNIGVIFCGTLITGMATSKQKDTFNGNVVALMLACIGCCLLSMCLFYYINKKVLADPRFYDSSQVKPKKKKAKVSAAEGIKILFKSKYLLLVAVLVMGYGIGINLSEGIFNNRLKAALALDVPKNQLQNAFLAMKGKLAIATGVLTILAIFVGSNILRRCSWKTSALMTPVLLLLTGIVFFIVVACDHLWGIKTLFGVQTLWLAVWTGFAQDAIGKSIKYSLFDTTKSMTYIPLDHDTKTKGQAAVEVIGGRAGKAGGSLIQQILLGTAAGATLIDFFVPVAIIFTAIVFSWIASVIKLSPMYEKALTDKENAQEVAPTN